jgi:hypothetical protein
VGGDKRYEHVKGRLRAMGEGTVQQVHDAMDQPNPYSLREVENVLDELVGSEPNDYEKAGDKYRWKKSYRFSVGT